MGTTKHYLKKMLPASLLQARLHKKIFLHFCERNGFVYFGSINQRENDHRLVRGLTLASGNKDSHYCLGSYEGYDITIVERSDLISSPGHTANQHTWLIMAFDLHSTRDFPHVFLSNTTHSEAFYRHIFTKFSYLNKIELPGDAKYPTSFKKHRNLYAGLRDHNDVMVLMSPEFVGEIDERLGSLTFEVNENVLYVYAEHQRINFVLLQRMLRNGHWLTRELDARIN